MLTEEQSRAWRPRIEGWSDDILPFYEHVAQELRSGDHWAEVGVYFGRSLFFLAEQLVAMGKTDVVLWAIDSWEGPKFRAQILKTLVGNRYYGLSDAEIDMIKIVSADQVRAARLFDDRSLAGVFLDADHSRDGMARALNAWFGKVRNGGLLCGHDYDRSEWPGVVEAVDEFCGPVGHPTRSVWALRKHG